MPPRGRMAPIQRPGMAPQPPMSPPAMRMPQPPMASVPSPQGMGGIRPPGLMDSGGGPDSIMSPGPRMGESLPSPQQDEQSGILMALKRLFGM